MKQGWLGALAGAVLAAGAGGGCGGTKPVLHVYTWADYVKPELVQRFEKENGCRVIMDTFDSNEAMYAKLKAGATGYDLLFPSSYMVKMMHAQGMLQDLDAALLPNAAHADPEYLRIALDPQMKHSVPYMLTNTGLGYRTGKVPDFQATWTVFDRADLRGHMTMLNDMRETMGAALKLLGFSLNTRNAAELEQARDVVIRWKKNLAKFENEQYKTGLASGEFKVVHGYSGDILQVKEEEPDIGFAVPKEGTSISCDDMVIPKDAKQVALAHRLINFLHDPAVAAENSDFIGYVCPNKDAYPLISEELRNNPAVFLPPEVRAKCEVIGDVGDALPLYTKMWDEIKAAE
jgi:spermidine/putrescine transport system substrate-binding protein